MKKRRISSLKIAGSIGIPLAMLLAAFLFTSILMLIVGGNPLVAFSAMFKGAFGGRTQIIQMIQRAVPIAICGFAVAFSSKVGLFNIGVEGQVLMGALGSTIAGVYFAGLPAWLHLPISLLTGMAFGMIWSLIPAVLLAERKVVFVVSSLFMNLIASNVIQYFIFGPMKGEGVTQPSTERIAETAELPNIISSPKLSYAFVLLFLVAVVYHIYIRRTYSGYELRVTGGNAQAARFAGISTRKYIYIAILVAGALGGMAGSVEIQGRYYRLIDGFSPGYGWDALPIALLSGGNPVGICLASILFGAMYTGASAMQIEAGISSVIINVIQGFLIISISMEKLLRFLLLRRSVERKKASRQSDHGEEATG